MGHVGILSGAQLANKARLARNEASWGITETEANGLMANEPEEYEMRQARLGQNDPRHTRPGSLRGGAHTAR